MDGYIRRREEQREGLGSEGEGVNEFRIRKTFDHSIENL